MKIVIHTDDADQWQEALAAAFPDASVITSKAPAKRRQGADYLAVWKAPGYLLAEQTRLKGIINLGAGVDHLLNTPELPKDVPIIKLRDAGMSELMADYTLYGVLHFYRSLDHYARQQRRACWQPWPVTDKARWPVGVLGLGAIGAQVAQRIHDAGFPVIGWSRSPKTIPGITCRHDDDGLEELLGQVQCLVTMLPDTPATRAIVNAERLARLPAGACIINPGRGSLIDESALLEALGDEDTPGHLRGALLDVFPEEPLPEHHPLWQHPRVWITPHMAAPTPIQEAIGQVIETIKDVEAGTPPAGVTPSLGY